MDIFGLEKKSFIMKLDWKISVDKVYTKYTVSALNKKLTMGNFDITERNNLM